MEVLEHEGEVALPLPVSTSPFTNLPSEGETQDSDPQLSSDQPVPPDDLSSVVLELEISEPPSDLHLPGDQGDKEAVGREEGDHEKPPLPMSEPPLDLAPLPTSGPPPDVHLPRDQIDAGAEEEEEEEDEKPPIPPLPMSKHPPNLLKVESPQHLPMSEPPPNLFEVESHPPLPMSEPPADLFKVISSPPLPTSEPPPDLHLPEQDNGEVRAEEEEGEHEKQDSPLPPTNLPEETKGGQLPSQRKHGRPTPIKLPNTSQIVADQRPSSPLGEVMYKVMTNTMYL